MLPSEFPEIQKYPNLKGLLRSQVDMQFRDLRTIFLLPKEENEGGCNFTATSIIFNIIAGSSVCFYKASKTALLDGNCRGKRFKGMLDKFYPWEGEPIKKYEGISILYGSARNPLTHSFGFDLPDSDEESGVQVSLKKWPLKIEEVYEIEDSINRPAYISPTIAGTSILEYGAKEYVISVPSLYWGVHRLLHDLFSDLGHVAKAEKLSKYLQFYWKKQVSEVGVGRETLSVERKCGACNSGLVSNDGGKTFICLVCNS